ncbi:hypothetical protein FI667_g7015, partial [Globisporangium splendens]
MKIYLVSRNTTPNAWNLWAAEGAKSSSSHSPLYTHHTRAETTEANAPAENSKDAEMNEVLAVDNNEPSGADSPQKKVAETPVVEESTVETADERVEEATANDECEGKNDADVKATDTVDATSAVLKEGEKQQSGEETAEIVTEEDEAPQPEETPKVAVEEKGTDTQKAKKDVKNQTLTPKRVTRTPVSSVGKSAVKERTTPADKKTPPAKMPSSAKVTSSSKKFEVLHAKQLAKEPTIYEHDKAKKAKADSLLTFSAARATRSSTKKEALSAKKATESAAATAPSVGKKIMFKPTRKHVSVAEKPTISSSLKRTSPKRVSASTSRGPNTLQQKKAPFTSTVNTAARKNVAAEAAASSAGTAKTSGDATKAKKSLNYKPYTGPLPKYKEDPIFSPVDKSKIEAAKENAKPKPVHHTPAKKKVNDTVKPGVSTPAAKATTKTAASAQRASVKKSVDVAAKTKENRRAKFAQDAKVKTTASRQSPRKHGVAAEKAA